MHRPVLASTMMTARMLRRMSTSVALAMLAVVTVAGTSIGQATADGQPLASLTHVSCGQTIVTDTKLDGDLVDCPNNGIVIGADDVTLDLNGHVIDGDGTEFADCPPDEPCDIGVVDLDHHGVTIKGGKVGEFVFGALVVGASNSRLAQLVLSNNLFSGLLVADSSRSEIEEITASANGLTTDQAGIDIFDSHDLEIERNAVFENGDIGFFIVGLDDSRLEKNTVARNPEAGILLDGNGNELSYNRFSEGEVGIAVVGDANTIAENRLSGTECPDECGIGIALEGGTGNVIEDNRVVRFPQAGIRVGPFEPDAPPTVASTVRGNLIRASGGDGLFVESTVVDTLLERNIAIGAGDDGIDVDSAATTVTRNLALRNGDLGIEAVPGVTDGGGNKARANGNPAQCTTVRCELRCERESVSTTRLLGGSGDKEVGLAFRGGRSWITERSPHRRLGGPEARVARVLGSRSSAGSGWRRTRDPP